MSEKTMGERFKMADQFHEPFASPAMYVGGGPAPRSGKPHRASGYVLRKRLRGRGTTKGTRDAQ